MRKTEIKDKKYHELVCKGKVFNNYTFADCDFTDCTFIDCTFVDCNFENCDLEKISTSKFISCSFSSCVILGLDDSYLFDCQFNDVSFSFNTLVQGNTFDRVRGNARNGGCLGVLNNTFKDMDFSGFVDLYCITNAYDNSGHQVPNVDLVQNSFINTTISIDAIRRLARKTSRFGSVYAERGNISPITSIVIRLNMEKLSNEEKFGLIANAFLRLPKVEEDVLFYDPETSSLLKSHFHLFFVDNPMPPKIVDKDGRELRPDAISMPDMQIDFCKEVTDATSAGIMLDAECGKYGVDITNGNIYNPEGIQKAITFD